MSETLFTPGPWHNVAGDIYDNRSDDAPGIPLMRSERGNYRSWGRELSDAERQANAALIAAAPAMFALLSNCRDAIASLDVGDLGWGEPGDGAQYPIRNEFLASIDAVLAKATPTAL